MGEQTHHIFKDAVTQQNVCLFLHQPALLKAPASCLQMDPSVDITLLYTTLDSILTSYSFLSAY